MHRHVGTGDSLVLIDPTGRACWPTPRSSECRFLYCWFSAHIFPAWVLADPSAQVCDSVFQCYGISKSDFADRCCFNVTDFQKWCCRPLLFQSFGFRKWRCRPLFSCMTVQWHAPFPGWCGTLRSACVVLGHRSGRASVVAWLVPPFVCVEMWGVVCDALALGFVMPLILLLTLMSHPSITNTYLFSFILRFLFFYPQFFLFLYLGFFLFIVLWIGFEYRVIVFEVDKKGLW